MGSWIDESMRPIAVMNMDDDYLRRAIDAMARGRGRSAEAVRECVDEVYAKARERGMIKGFRSFVLRRYTLFIWKNGRPREGEPPFLIRRMLASLR